MISRSNSFPAVGVGLWLVLAGGAAVMMLLPGIVAPSRAATLVYLGAFSFGSMMAMAALAQLLARATRLAHSQARVAAFGSILLGAIWTLHAATE
ncbi:hypothetical protein [Polyangium jinanense]|uniref:Uncharacterized protein n=1 Tax=Polyangium jinanense TaxID=2829994 RepID=A0A9X3XD19_9BACT|nr:hypothetical protein [Polyangium jinanense]MDC3959803.1 hypothetical protein [Polyangium jinanense]MDC3988052.1 hypothetical protein [Polyangium jinanense]